MNYEYYYTDDIAKKMEEMKRSNNKPDNYGLVIPAVVLGIASLVMFLFGINLIMSVVSVIMAIIYLVTNGSNKNKTGIGLAITAIATSVLSVVLFFGSWMLIMSNINNLAPMLQEEFDVEYDDNFDDFDDYDDFHGGDIYDDDFFDDFLNEYEDDYFNNKQFPDGNGEDIFNEKHTPFEGDDTL